MGQLNYTTEKTNELLEKVNDMPETVTDGKTPVLETGTTTTLDPGQNATSEVVANGTDDEGNPKYKLNFGIPKGYDGSGGSGGGGTADSVQWANVLNKPSWVNSSTKPAYTASEVGALPSDTQIPSKTSQLTNDSGFTTSASFKTVNGQSIVGSGNIVIEGGGGDTPSAGGGNVNVTNGSALKSTSYYAFKPSADGSLDGAFSVIPNASEEKEGLMSSTDKTKLNTIKAVFALDIAAETLTDNSTPDEILQVFKPTLNIIGEVYYLVIGYSDYFKGNYEADIPQFYIGNIRTDAMFTFDNESNTGTMQLTWVNSGTLKTLTITVTAESLSCKVTESGGGADDTYYLPAEVFNLEAGATSEEIIAKFGGEEAYSNAVKASSLGKKLYIHSNILANVPVSVANTFGIFGFMVFFYPYLNGFYIKYISESKVKIIYPGGYELKPEVYSLISSSSSEDISTAVGGETGLKKIIQAVKDGNRLVINYTENELYQSIDLLSPLYTIKENGDMALGFAIIQYTVLASIKFGYLIQYTKSSNTFSCLSAELK